LKEFWRRLGGLGVSRDCVREIYGREFRWIAINTIDNHLGNERQYLHEMAQLARIDYAVLTRIRKDPLRGKESCAKSFAVIESGRVPPSNNLHALGGQMIRIWHEQPHLRKRGILRMLLEAIGDDGGPIVHL
jgi:hypothetical protein